MKQLYVHKFFTLSNFKKYRGECQTEEIVTDKDWDNYRATLRDWDDLIHLNTNELHVDWKDND